MYILCLKTGVLSFSFLTKMSTLVEVDSLVTGLVASWALAIRPIEWGPEAILKGQDELRPAQVKAQGRGGADRKPV